VTALRPAEISGRVTHVYEHPVRVATFELFRETRPRHEEYIGYAHCPFGGVGDVLAVRELWRVAAWDEDTSSILVDYKTGPPSKRWHAIDEERFPTLWIQSTNDARAAGLQTDAEGQYHWEASESPCRWRPAVTMPAALARWQFTVEGVEAKRALLIPARDHAAANLYHRDDWDRRYPAYPWASNPLLWVIRGNVEDRQK
jgi:hypothetical protein